MYAIIFNFDKKSDKKIRKVFRFLKEKNLAPYMHESKNSPHIGTAIFDSYDEKLATTILPDFAEKHPPISLQFAGMGIFTGESPVIYFSPVVTNELLELHKELNTLMFPYINNPLSLYMPGNWMPHCTIGFKFPKKNLSEIIHELNNIEFPIDFIINSFQLIEIPVKTIVEFNFTG